MSCPSTITGTALAGVICDYDNGTSVTVENGGEVGGITQATFLPSPGLITNNGTISNNTDPGINISGAVILSGGIINNGDINTDTISIYIDSSIVGNITNNGQIVSANSEGIGIRNSSAITGDLTNTGTLTAGSNNSGVTMVFSATINGSLFNSGTIEGGSSSGNGVILSSGSSLLGDLDNSGNINGDLDGVVLINVSNIGGDIKNSSTITGTTGDAIRITQASDVGGDILNSGTIQGGNNGITVSSLGTIDGIINQAGATITGGSDGISIDDSSTMNNSIQNRGTIMGGSRGIFVSADSTVSNIDLFNDSRVVGAIDAVNTDVNILGDFTSEGAMNVNNININSGSILTLANTITAQNSVNNAGTLAIGTTAQTINSGYIQSTGGALKLGVLNTGTYGQLLVNNTVDLSQSGAIDVDIASGFSLNTGDVLTNIISAGTLVGPTSGFAVSDDSLLLNFEASLNGATGIDLEVIADANNSIAESNAEMGNHGGAGAAQALDDILASNSGGDWANIVSALGTLTSDEQVTSATNQTTPALTGATNVAMIETISTASRVVQSRQEANSGFASGEEFQTNRNFWLRSFGSWGEQGTIEGVVGYDSESYGMMAGADKDISDETRLGVGVTYFNSDLSSNDNNSQVNIDSYLGTIYGSYSIDKKTDVNAQVDIGYSSSESTRHIDFGGLNRTAKGNYGGWDFHTGTGIGHMLNVGNDTVIIPQARMDYFLVRNESYNESGAGVLNLNVDSQTEAQLIPAVELKASHKITPELTLALNGGVGYDLLNDDNTVSASFAGGGTFVTRGLEPSPWIARTGAGVTWSQNDALDLTARYDRKDRSSDYDDQTLSLKLNMAF